MENKNIFQNKINNLENHLEDFDSEKNKLIIMKNSLCKLNLILKINHLEKLFRAEIDYPMWDTSESLLILILLLYSEF